MTTARFLAEIGFGALYLIVSSPGGSLANLVMAGAQIVLVLLRS